MNNNFCINGKRAGIVGSAISNFWSYVLFVFVVIVFFIFFHIQEKEIRENFIGSLESEANIDIVAVNYLRTPINFEKQSVLSASERNFASFLQEHIAFAYTGPTDLVKFREAIDAAKGSLKGDINRLMIFLDNGACLYDSRNMECLVRQVPYGLIPIPEGVVFLPVPVGQNGIKIVEVVFQ